MDSEKIFEQNKCAENNIAQQSNGGSERSPLKLPFIIGVAGGTASGKTTVCDMIITQLRDQRVVLVNQDAFYRSLSEEQLRKVSEYNFDHPDAFDTELLLSCMEKLKHGKPVSIPNYDFKSHKSVEPSRVVNPSDVIILEGILVLHDSRVRDLMNMKIFVDTEVENRGCSAEDLLLEMDRMLRPEGFVIIRDKSSTINYVHTFLSSLKWDKWTSDVEPSADALSRSDERVLIARKHLWLES